MRIIPGLSSLNKAFKGRMPMIVLCLLGIGFNAFLYGPSLRLTAFGINDFMSMYAGGRLAFTGGLYDLNQNLLLQRETAGWQNVDRLFVRPPFDALLMWPLARLPFLLASHVWEILIVAAIALFCCLWPGDRKTAALACCWSYPLFDVFANGQDVAILLVLIALAMREMKRGRDTKAGLLFSLCSIKFHLLFLLPILILRQRLWRFLAGLALGGAILLAVSFALAGWNWPMEWATLVRNPVSNPWPDAMPSVHGLTADLAHGGLWQAAGTLAVALLAWLACRKGGFEQGLAAVLVAGILVAPHAYLSDCALALPALLITLPLATAAWQRYFHLFLLSPMCSIWTVIHHTWITAAALITYLALMAFVLSRNGRASYADTLADSSPHRSYSSSTTSRAAVSSS
jgi:hypothetical protein